MKSFNFIYDKSTLKKLQLLKDEKNILIQIFSGERDKKCILTIIEELKDALPNATIIGATSEFSILNAKLIEKKVVISITVFESTTLKTTSIECSHKSSAFNMGVKVANTIITKDTKAIIIFTNGVNANTEELIKGVENINNKISVVGGLVGNIGNFETNYLYTNDVVINSGVVAVSLNSEFLTINEYQLFGWRAIGKTFTITKAEKNRIYEIDGVSVVEIYKKYLGEKVANELPYSGVEFPFMIKRNSISIARSVVKKFEDNSILVGGDISIGDKVTFCYADEEVILSNAKKLASAIKDDLIELSFIYSSNARKRFISNIELEFEPFNKLAPTIGFLTYGEFFHINNSNELLNQATTILTLSEKAPKSERKSLNIEEEYEDIDKFKALSHFVNATTKELELSQKHTRMILDSQPNIVIETDRGKNILDANKTFFTFFDKYSNLIEFKKDYNCICDTFEKVDDEDNSYIHNFEDKNWLTYLLDNKNRNFKVVILKDSKPHTFNISAKQMIDSSDKAIVTLNDITELECMKDDKMNDIKLASIGKLTAGITHEINTPLTYIKGNLELLSFDINEIEDYKLKTHISQTLQTVHEGINRISNIIESMKEIIGKTSNNKEELNLYTTFIYALRMIHARAKYKSNIYINKTLFSMELDKDNEVFICSAYRQKLEQVWIIILNNALDEFAKSPLAFENRIVDIEISKENDKIKVLIKDNAGGIAKDIIDKIFEPFVSNKVQSGMGIGLNVAELIIKKHNGTIRAYNTLHPNGAMGAVFEVII